MDVMTAAGDSDGLPPALSLARKSVALPEVQDMIRRLGAYGLGVCLPHAHDEATGAFKILPENMVSVERGQRVSFRDINEVAQEAFVEVGWQWAGDSVTGIAACYKRCVTRPHDSQHYSQHNDEIE